MTVSELTKVRAVEVLSKPGLKVAEYFGAASTGDTQLSACLATVTGKCSEAHQTPEFDEYVLVVSGRLRLERGSQALDLAQGEGATLRAGQRVLWRWREPCQYAIICLPGLAPCKAWDVRAGFERPARREQPPASPPKRCFSPFAPVHADLVSDLKVGKPALFGGAWNPSTQSMAHTEDPRPSSEATTESGGVASLSPRAPESRFVDMMHPPSVSVVDPAVDSECLMERGRSAASSEVVDPAVDSECLMERGRSAASSEAEDRPARYGARHLNTPVVIVASELHPWSKTGGLAMVASAYAYEFAVRGHRTMAVSPRYGEYEKCQYVGRAKVWLGGQQHEVRYFHQRQEYGAGKGCDYVFVDHHSFRRAGIYGDPVQGDYEDNLFRFGLLSVAAAEAPLVLELGGSAYGQEVCFIANDWQTGLLPLFLFYKYKRNQTYQKARCIMVLHNLGYQGKFRKSKYPVDRFLGLPLEAANDLQGEDANFGRDCLNLLSAGIKCADRILTVSPSYAREIQTSEGGFGLHSIVQEKASTLRLAGILNGISDEWSPLNDPYIARKYGPSDFEEGKRQCKAALQRGLGLPEDDDVALIGFCGRLCFQKGVHLITSIIPWLMQYQDRGLKGRTQLILMGKGDPGYERQLVSAEAANPCRVCGYVGFDPVVEHNMMAGCDLLLMPSQYEPCGLPQMYAQQYGAIPVAHQTGGLRDSVKDLADEVRDGRTATGFLFREFSVTCLTERLYTALDIFFNNRALFRQMQVNAMQSNFFWPKAIDEYEKQIDFTMEDTPCRG